MIYSIYDLWLTHYLFSAFCTAVEMNFCIFRLHFWFSGQMFCFLLMRGSMTSAADVESSAQPRAWQHITTKPTIFIVTVIVGNFMFLLLWNRAREAKFCRLQF